jgi:hypothetical protein
VRQYVCACSSRRAVWAGGSVLSAEDDAAEALRGRTHTSGKVPLEKTLRRCQWELNAIRGRWWVCIHEQAGLPAGAVADNDQLATDFRHLRRLLIPVPTGGGPRQRREVCVCVWCAVVR